MRLVRREKRTSPRPRGRAKQRPGPFLARRSGSKDALTPIETKGLHLYRKRLAMCRTLSWIEPRLVWRARDWAHRTVLVLTAEPLPCYWSRWRCAGLSYYLYKDPRAVAPSIEAQLSEARQDCWQWGLIGITNRTLYQVWQHGAEPQTSEATRCGPGQTRPISASCAELGPEEEEERSAAAPSP